MPGRSQVSGEQPAIFKYTGKELDDENALEWYYFGARYYDGEIGRWLIPDPLASQTPWLTPYHYCSNNPLGRIDPDGAADKSAVFWALGKIAGAGVSYGVAWKGQVVLAGAGAGSGGTLAPLSVAGIIGLEATKAWSLVNIGLGIQDLQLALSVPDGVDAIATGNLAYEIASGLGIEGSKKEIIGFIGDVLMEGTGIADNLLSAQNIRLLGALLQDATITNDVKNIIREVLKEKEERDKERAKETERRRKEDEETRRKEEEKEKRGGL
ncbi:MAG: hypothetical protein GF353_08565 [Candidatus Lokiarchaeota archaeon]|nr:hypothetical protein [Candidatus Lokiarchaeota archaeon]